MSLMGKATEKGLETVSKAVLGPAFHEAESTPKKVSNPIFAFLRRRVSPSSFLRAPVCYAVAGLSWPCGLPVAETLSSAHLMLILEIDV